MLQTSYGLKAAQGGTSNDSNLIFNCCIYLLNFYFILQLHFQYERNMKSIQVLNQEKNPILIQNLNRLIDYLLL